MTPQSPTFPSDTSTLSVSVYATYTLVGVVAVGVLVGFLGKWYALAVE